MKVTEWYFSVVLSTVQGGLDLWVSGFHEILKCTKFSNEFWVSVNSATKAVFSSIVYGGMSTFSIFWAIISQIIHKTNSSNCWFYVWFVKLWPKIWKMCSYRHILYYWRQPWWRNSRKLKTHLRIWYTLGFHEIHWLISLNHLAQ